MRGRRRRSYKMGFGLAWGVRFPPATRHTCQSGSGQAASQTWQLSQAYGRPGTYTVAVTVQANCTLDRATATVTVTIG